ncbi:MAG: FxsA family protein, partial [Syntrophobacterales bacterium]
PGDLGEMFYKLFLAFTLIPFIEIYLLIKIGAQVGAFNTILIVIVTGLLGASLARLEGIKTMTKVRESLNRGELPAEEMLDAMLIFTAGVVLLTPGFLTDLAGLTLLVPKARYWFKRWLRKKFDEWLVKGSGKGGTSIRF